MEKSESDQKTTSSSAAGETSRRGDDTSYKGVRKRKWGKWVSEIRLPNSRERIWLGSHDSAEKAARAFDAALFCLRGRDAKFNFPNCPPDIPGAGSLTRHEIQLAAARYASEGAPEPEGSTPTSEEEGDVSEDRVDWSFLDRLGSNEVVSDFGLGSGLQYDVMMMDRDLYPASPVAPPHDYDVIGNGGDENDGEGYYAHQHSFLWNF